MAQLATVDFHGDQLEAVQDGGKVWVSLRRCCECLGVAFDAQRVKLQEKRWACVTEIVMQAEGDVQKRSYVMIDLKTLSGWLFSIDSRKVPERVRGKLERYQDEAAEAIRDHFFAPPRPVIVPYSNRVARLREVRGVVPGGFWCVFVEAAPLLIDVERLFATAGLPMEEDDLLDGSVGRRWADFRKGKPWAMPPTFYPHPFPPELASGRAGRSYPAKCYRNEELLEFRRWLDSDYVVAGFWEYVRAKYGTAGVAKALPPAATVFALPQPSRT